MYVALVVHIYIMVRTYARSSAAVITCMLRIDVSLSFLVLKSFQKHTFQDVSFAPLKSSENIAEETLKKHCEKAGKSTCTMYKVHTL